MTKKYTFDDREKARKAAFRLHELGRAYKFTPQKASEAGKKSGKVRKKKLFERQKAKKNKNIQLIIKNKKIWK